MRRRWRGRRDPGDGGHAELDASLSQTWEAAAAAVGQVLDLPAGKEALLARSGRRPDRPEELPEELPDGLPEEGTADLPAPGGMTREVARRRRLLLRSGAAVAALAAAAVVLVAVGVPGAGHNGTEAPAVNTAYVVKRVDSALSAADPGAIAQMTVTTRSAAAPGGTTTTATAEEWSSGGQWRSVTYSPAGHQIYDEGFGTASGYTLVNYLTRTWARRPGLGRPVKQAPGPRGCGPVVAALPVLFQPGLPGLGFSAASGPATVARALRGAISCGSLTVAGRQRVDGIDAIKLTSPSGSAIPATIWVNPDTYLPVRVMARPVPGTSVLQQTADITWLPPTTQNLAKLTVPIPAGFRRVPLAQAVTPSMQRIPG
jgi:hypothetical protein